MYVCMYVCMYVYTSKQENAHIWYDLDKINDDTTSKAQKIIH